MTDRPRPGDRVRVTIAGVYDGTDSAKYNGQGFDLHFVKTDQLETGRIAVPADATVEVIEPADDPSKDPVGTVYKNLDPYGNGPVVKVASEAWIVATTNPGGSGLLGEGYTRDQWVGHVIGAVPGTPAWEKWLSGELTGTEHRLTEVVKLDDIFPNAVETTAVDEGVTADSDPYPRYWESRSFTYRVVAPGAHPEYRNLSYPEDVWDRSTGHPTERDLKYSIYVTRYYPWTGDGSTEPPERVQQVRDSQGYVVTRAAGGWLDSRTGRTDPWNVAYAAYGPYTEVID